MNVNQSRILPAQMWSVLTVALQLALGAVQARPAAPGANDRHSPSCTEPVAQIVWWSDSRFGYVDPSLKQLRQNLKGKWRFVSLNSRSDVASFSGRFSPSAAVAFSTVAGHATASRPAAASARRIVWSLLAPRVVFFIAMTNASYASGVVQVGSAAGRVDGNWSQRAALSGPRQSTPGGCSSGGW